MKFQTPLVPETKETPTSIHLKQTQLQKKEPAIHCSTSIRTDHPGFTGDETYFVLTQLDGKLTDPSGSLAPPAAGPPAWH